MPCGKGDSENHPTGCNLSAAATEVHMDSDVASNRHDDDLHNRSADALMLQIVLGASCESQEVASNLELLGMESNSLLLVSR